MSHSFILNCCWLTHKFHMHQGRKTWNAKVIFRGAYTGCQEPGLLSLDINDAWWPETVWWLHLTDHDPHILRQIYTPYTHSFATWRHHGGLSKFSGGVVKASEWSLFTKSAQRPVHGSLHQPCTGGEILPSARLEFSRTTHWRRPEELPVEISPACTREDPHDPCTYHIRTPP